MGSRPTLHAPAWRALAFGLVLGSAALAQTTGRFAQFDDWFRRYREGRIVFLQGPGRLPAGVQADALEGDAEFPRVLRECTKAQGRDAAERLLSLASFRFNDDPAIEANRFGLHLPQRVREEALAALVSLAQRETVEYLARDVLLDRTKTSAARRAAAAEALGKLRDSSALLALYGAASDPSPAVRAAAIDAAARLGGAKESAIRRSLEDSEASVRLRGLETAQGALPQIADPKQREPFLEAVRKRLADEDWRVREKATEVIAAFPTKEAVPALITALAAERDRMPDGSGRKRVLLRIGETLGQVTGIDIPTLDAARWQKWWEVAGSRFELGTEVTGRPKTRADVPSYFTIPIKTDRMVFVVDVSGSMEEPYGPPPVSTGPQEKPLAGPPSGGAWTKLDRVKNELLRVVHLLTDSDLFQIVAFSDEAHAVFPKLVPATKENRRIAERFVRSLRAHGGTALYDALAGAMGLRLAGATSGPEPDTVFILTDGQPSVGSVVDTGEIVRRIDEMNRSMRLRIHSLYAGQDCDPAALFLGELSKHNGGEFRRIAER